MAQTGAIVLKIPIVYSEKVGRIGNSITKFAFSEQFLLKSDDFRQFPSKSEADGKFTSDCIQFPSGWNRMEIILKSLLFIQKK